MIPRARVGLGGVGRWAPPGKCCERPGTPAKLPGPQALPTPCAAGSQPRGPAPTQTHPCETWRAGPAGLSSVSLHAAHSRCGLQSETPGGQGAGRGRGWDPCSDLRPESFLASESPKQGGDTLMHLRASPAPSEATAVFSEGVGSGAGSGAGGERGRGWRGGWERSVMSAWTCWWGRPRPGLRLTAHSPAVFTHGGVGLGAVRPGPRWSRAQTLCPGPAPGHHAGRGCISSPDPGNGVCGAGRPRLLGPGCPGTWTRGPAAPVGTSCPAHGPAWCPRLRPLGPGQMVGGSAWRRAGATCRLPQDEMAF